MADAGWYPDAHDPNSQAYFDGQNWTGHRRPNPASDETMRRGDLTEDRGGQQNGAQPQQSWQQPPQDWQQQPQQSWQQPQQDWQQQPQQAWQQPHQPQQSTAQWATPGEQQWTQPGAAQWGQPGEQAWQPPAPARKSRRTKIAVAAAAAVIVVAGAITWLAWPDDPDITYNGKEVASADQTLTSAEKSVADSVKTRHGAKNADTRCYFAKPKKPGSGKEASDVEDSLRCGPVLFVDGERSAAYLSVPLTEKAGDDAVELTPSDDVGDLQPAALGSDTTLVRPDGESAPTANGGAGELKVPAPPAAQKDLLTTATLTDTTAVKSLNTSLVGKNLKVTLTKLGQISRYGTGDDARSAPSGQQLVAFQLTYGSGDVDGSGDTAAGLAVDSGTPREIPDASGDKYVIAAIPTSGASIVFTDGGVRQSIALPSGKAGSDAITVLQRSSRTAFLFKSVSVPIVASRPGSKSITTTFRTTAALAALDFWAPGNTDVHASNPRNAILSVRLTYTDSKSPGKTYGYPPEFLTLQTAGKNIKARNVASGGKINNVFEVPGNFTAGYLVISGSSKLSDNVTIKTRSAKRIPVRIG